MTKNTITVHYYDEALKDYISDYFVDSLMTKDPSGWTCVHPATLHVTLLRVKKECRTFGNAKSPATVFKFVVMDGSNYVFLMTINTGSSHKFVNVDLTPGSTILVESYKWITLEPPALKRGTISRGFIFADKVEVKPAPFSQKKKQWTKDDESAVTLEYCTAILDEEIILHALESAYVVFTNPVAQDCDGDIILGTMSEDNIERAMFIADENLRRKFVRQNKKSKRSIKSLLEESNKENVKEGGKIKCECENHGFTECVLNMYPLEYIEEDDLFDEIEHRLKGALYHESFHTLPNNHKRWAYYWWYAVNIFHVGARRIELPACFLQGVRDEYPNDIDEKYTGFKSKTDS